MATILFPTRVGRRTHLGQPERARACRCQSAWLDHEDGCVRCGHFPEPVIRETWRAQARRMARVGNQPAVVVTDRVRYRRESRSPELAGVAL